MLTQPIDPKDKKTKKKKPLTCVQENYFVCVEFLSDVARFGRFTLGTQGKAFAAGKLTCRFQLPGITLKKNGSSYFYYAKGFSLGFA